MNYEKYKKQYLDSAKEQMEKDKKAQEDIYNSQEEQTNTQYGAAITEAKESYDELYRANEVRRLINEKKIKETMANMGLTDSGLSRTQITANQLSSANIRGGLDRDKQKAVDDYTLKLTDAIATIKQNKTAALAGIDQAYESSAAEYASDEVQAAAIKAQQSAASDRNTAYETIKKAMLNGDYEEATKKALLKEYITEYADENSETDAAKIDLLLELGGFSYEDLYTATVQSTPLAPFSNQFAQKSPVTANRKINGKLLSLPRSSQSIFD